MKKIWSLYELQFIENNLDVFNNEQLAEITGKTKGQVGWCLAREGWRRNGIKQWTAKEIAWIKANAHLGEHGLAKALNIDQVKIGTMLNNHKIRTGNVTKFKKGDNPWNAGRHVRMSPKSEFKKGFLPSNTKYNGAITIRKDNRGVSIRFIRLSPAVWTPLARHVYKQAHGPIPPGHVVIHKDGDILNCEPNNLALITTRENMLRNMNHEKAKISMKSAWEEGKFYDNDHYIATRITADKELQQIIVKNPQLIALKRTQLISKRATKQTQSI